MAVLKVVLFDLDDTLFEHARAVRHGVESHRRAHGGPMAAADEHAEWTRWTELEELHYHRYLSGEIGFREQRRERARGFVEPFGLDLSDDTAADEWFGRYLLEYRSAWRLHDDVPALFDSLPGVRFGIITNAELQFQLEKLRALEITDRFEHVIASAQVGFAKPAPEIFRHAAELFGVEPVEAVYVGDRLQTDAIGAAHAGMRGVWLDRLGTASENDLAEATANSVSVIRSLDELPALLLRD